jgi:hypothetical protein
VLSDKVTALADDVDQADIFFTAENMSKGGSAENFSLCEKLFCFISLRLVSYLAS